MSSKVGIYNRIALCVCSPDEFATPLSSPPSEEETYLQQLSQPAPPTELQSALVQQSVSQSQVNNISEK